MPRTHPQPLAPAEAGAHGRSWRTTVAQAEAVRCDQARSDTRPAMGPAFAGTSGFGLPRPLRLPRTSTLHRLLRPQRVLLRRSRRSFNRCTCRSPGRPRTHPQPLAPAEAGAHGRRWRTTVAQAESARCDQTPDPIPDREWVPAFAGTSGFGSSHMASHRSSPRPERPKRCGGGVRSGVQRAAPHRLRAYPAIIASSARRSRIFSRSLSLLS